MAVGVIPLHIQNFLKWQLTGTAMPAPLAPAGGPYVKWHVGDPGAAGTANPAVYTQRDQAAMSTPSPTTGKCTNSGTITLGVIPVGGSETIQFVSLWTTAGPSGGVCIRTGTVTPTDIIQGTQPTVPPGGIVCSHTVAA